MLLRRAAALLARGPARHRPRRFAAASSSSSSSPETFEAAAALAAGRLPKARRASLPARVRKEARRRAGSKARRCLQDVDGPRTGSRHRRGCHVAIPRRRRDDAGDRLRRERTRIADANRCKEEKTDRDVGDTAAATRIVRERAAPDIDRPAGERPNPQKSKPPKQVAFRQKYECAACGCLLPPDHEVDHIVPVALNGSDSLANLQALCRPCRRPRATSGESRHRRGRRRGWSEGRGFAFRAAVSARVETGRAVEQPELVGSGRRRRGRRRELSEGRGTRVRFSGDAASCQ